MTAAVRSAAPGIVWPGIPDARASELLALSWQLGRSQWWSPEALRARQLQQLRCLAAHAIAQVPRYAGAACALGTDAARLEENGFARWPVLPKRDVRADPESLHARTYPATHGDWKETLTSGSTGEPVRVRHTALFGVMARALVAREHLLRRRDLSRKFAAIRLAAPGGMAPGWGLMSIAFDTGPSTTIDVGAGLSQQLAWLMAEAPGYLLGYPSNLRALILEAGRLGKRPAGLLELISFGEMIAPDLRETARSRWGVEVIDTYSCREAGSLAFQCPECEAFHVNAEGVYLEVLREDGEPCKAGETGRVVITPLHNFAMPLIRYEIGDFAEVGDTCPCGRGLPTLARIVGRVTRMAVDPTGRRYWPGLRASYLTKIAPFRQLQLVQHTAEEIELRYVLDGTLENEARQRCAGALAEMLGYPYRVRFTPLEEIPRGPGGKFEDFVSRLAG